MLDALKGLFEQSGFGSLYNAEEPFEYFGITSSFDFGTIIMILVSCLSGGRDSCTRLQRGALRFG